MGKVYRFLAINEEARMPLDWFAALESMPKIFEVPQGWTVYFDKFGPLKSLDSGEINVKKSPVISIFRPQLKRGILWMAGEIHFLSTPMRRLFPALHLVDKQFHQWLSQFELVFSRRASFNAEWNYYLEGSLRNWDSDLYAFPSAFTALQNGQYFISSHDNDFTLDKICRQLRLRGIECRGSA